MDHFPPPIQYKIDEILFCVEGGEWSKVKNEGHKIRNGEPLLYIEDILDFVNQEIQEWIDDA